MISLTNYDFQWARSELVGIYPDIPISVLKHSEQNPGAASTAERPGTDAPSQHLIGSVLSQLQGLASMK